MEKNKTVEVLESVDEENEEGIVLTYKITSYGADYPVDMLVVRMKEGNIVIPPFQREFVWNVVKASRFVESLLLGLPVPGIFLYKDEDTNKLVVIDGNQRLNTLRYFYDGIFHTTGREFILRGIKSQYKGETYKSLNEKDRRTLDESIIHATIVRQDEPSGELSSVFHIFERLNTGANPLVSQEIRSAIYSGEFNDLIKKLNSHKSWRNVFGKVSSRMRDQELILRFLALYFNDDKYKKPIREFLNEFMEENRHGEKHSVEEMSKVFIDTIGVIDVSLGDKAFRPRGLLMAAIFDAVMVGVARRLEKGKIKDFETLTNKYQELINNLKFADATETHTSDEDRVEKRISFATDAFENIK